MISRNFRLPRLIAILSVFIIVLQSCKKETNVGSSLIPDEDILNSTLIDTFTVETYTGRIDSILTEKISKVAIGEFNDLDFGITRGQLFAQFLLPSANVTFGTNPKIDSVILSFHVDTIYGSAGQQTTFKVFGLDQGFSSAVTSYYSTDSLSYSTEVGSANFAADTGTVKIKLQDTIGKYLLKASADDLSANDKFALYFNGLTIKAHQSSLNPGEGTLYIVNPTHVKTKLTLYYHNDASSGLSVDLSVNSSARYFAKYQHDYSGTSDLKNQLNDPSLGQSQLFLQPLAGTMIFIRFPHLNKWAADKQILIHRAELILPRKVGSDAAYPAPLGTILLKDSLNTAYPLQDWGDANYSGMSSPAAGVYYGGGFNNGEYRFIITQYLQKKINTQEDITKLILFTNANAITPGRVIIEGSDQNKVSRTKILVYYSSKK
jgi:hypothetical protein